MALQHLPPTSEAADVVAALRADGACVVDDLAPAGLMDRVAAEMAPHVDVTPEGEDDFIGRRTRRTGSMVARSPASRELITHPLVLAVAGSLLDKASVFQLHLTQVISVLPGESDQPLHRDELAWDFFPFPTDYDVQCNTIWALTDFTRENGATRVLPGTHLLPQATTAPEAAAGRSVERAVMRRGSVLFYTGKVFHGAGANLSGGVRQGINLTYSVGWLRQEENQYLSTPLEVAKTLDDDLLRLMGYQLGGIAIGYVGDFEDPMSTVRPRPKRQYDFAGQAARAEARRAAAERSAAGPIYDGTTGPDRATGATTP